MSDAPYRIARLIDGPGDRFATELSLARGGRHDEIIHALDAMFEALSRFVARGGLDRRGIDRLELMERQQRADGISWEFHCHGRSDEVARLVESAIARLAADHPGAIERVAMTCSPGGPFAPRAPSLPFEVLHESEGNRLAIIVSFLAPTRHGERAPFIAAWRDWANLVVAGLYAPRNGFPTQDVVGGEPLEDIFEIAFFHERYASDLNAVDDLLQEFARRHFDTALVERVHVS